MRTHHLPSDLNDSLEAEPPSTVIEQILQRGTEEINHKDVVKSLLPKVVDIGNAA